MSLKQRMFDKGILKERSSMGPNSPVIQELTFMLLVAAEPCIFQKGARELTL